MSTRANIQTFIKCNNPNQGMSYRAIARELNRLSIKTGRGCQWYDVTVKAALAVPLSQAA